MGSKPFVDERKTLILRSHECFDLLFGKVKSIPFVVRIANFHQMSLQLVKVGLGKPNTESNGGIWVRLAMFPPSSGWARDTLLDFARLGSLSRKGRERRRKKDKRRRYLHSQHTERLELGKDGMEGRFTVAIL
jgi:hypothetical protein